MVNRKEVCWRKKERRRMDGKKRKRRTKEMGREKRTGKSEKKYVRKKR